MVERGRKVGEVPTLFKCEERNIALADSTLRVVESDLSRA
jgi:hypothetical protein